MPKLYNEMGARALWAIGCRPGDLVFNCFNYSLYAGGIMDHMAFETIGSGILPYGVGRSERLLDLLSGFPAGGVPGSYALYSTPSYAIRLHHLAQARGLDLKLSMFAKGYFRANLGCRLKATARDRRGMGHGCQGSVWSRGSRRAER